jgi:hypothetical protein
MSMGRSLVTRYYENIANDFRVDYQALGKDKDLVSWPRRRLLSAYAAPEVAHGTLTIIK